jgi:hypothetical protein
MPDTATKQRATFTHTDVGALVTAYGKGGIDAATAAFPHIPRPRIEAKLEELGVVRVSPAARNLIVQFIGEIAKQENPTTVKRYAIRALRESLGGKESE